MLHDAVGHCGVTSDAGDCAHGSKGSWAAGQVNVHNLHACAEYARAHCPRARFVSFESSHADCSWYNECLRLQWQHGGLLYRSMQIRPSLPPAAASPPPPQLLGAPGNASVGYCSLMDSGLGDCELTDQGAWPGVTDWRKCQARCRRCQNCHFVSFTLSREPALPSAEQQHHAPYWWPCRWYARCDLEDLRQRPASSEPYLTTRVLPVRRLTRPRRAAKATGVAAAAEPAGSSAEGSVANPADAASSAASAAAASTGASRARPIHLGLVTLGAHDPNYLVYGGVDMRCAMAQWCQNARRLTRALPSSWRVDQLALGSPGLIDDLAASAGCSELKAVRPEARLEQVGPRCSPTHGLVGRGSAPLTHWSPPGGRVRGHACRS